MAATPFCWSGEFVIKKPWDDVMRAAQLKYPNPFNPNVLSIDIISRSIDKETGVLCTTKLINSSWPMFSSVGELRAVERTEVDPRRRYMLLESNNVDMRGVLKANERLEYEVHPDNPEWTLIRHKISVNAFRFIAYAALSASENTARSGREALKWVIENRIDHFMCRVPSKTDTSDPSSHLTPISSSFSRGATLSLPLWSRLRSLTVPSLQPKMGPAKTNPPSSSSPSPWLRQTYSVGSLPVSLEQVVTSFDSFHPIEALGDIRNRVTTDVTVLREQLRRRSQRVIERFSKVDEYVLIM
ncbi:PRELI domain containing protein 3A [Taenia solium]|eukprot:TsM_000834600 transcript=TsM_000834600 gene=TsM_000834600